MSLSGVFRNATGIFFENWPVIAGPAAISAGASYAISHLTRFTLFTPLVTAKFTAAALVALQIANAFDKNYRTSPYVRAYENPTVRERNQTDWISYVYLIGLGARGVNALVNPEPEHASFLKLCTLAAGSKLLFDMIDKPAFTYLQRSLQTLYQNAPQTLAAAYIAGSISSISTRLLSLDSNTAAIFAIAAASLRSVRMTFVPMDRRPVYQHYLADCLIASALTLTTKEVLHLKLPRYGVLGPVYVIAMTTFYVTDRLIENNTRNVTNYKRY